MLLDLFSFCVYYHGYRVKYFFLRNQALSKITGIARHPDMVIVTAVVRFIRTCMGLKDEFYSRLIVKNDLLGPTMERFLQNGTENNLLQSSVLELLEFARREGMRGVMMYIWERYGEKLKLVLDGQRYEIFKYRYNNLLAARPAHERFTNIRGDLRDNFREEYGGAFNPPFPLGGDEDAREVGYDAAAEAFSGAPAPPMLQRREMDSMEDEAYFNFVEEDEEDLNAADINMPRMPVRLVDYDDDDFVVGQPQTQEAPAQRHEPADAAARPDRERGAQAQQAMGGMPIKIRLNGVGDAPPAKRQREPDAGGVDKGKGAAASAPDSKRAHGGEGGGG